MANRIVAINTYRPRLSLNKAADTHRFMELVTLRSTLSPGVVLNVHESEVETLIGLLLEGRPVHTGIGIYTPSVDLDGDLEVKVKLDPRVLSALNAANAYRGDMVNIENIGKSADELVNMWNTEHPEDPVA